MPHLTNRATITHASNNQTKVILADEAFTTTNSDGVARFELRYNGDSGYITPNTLLALPYSKVVTAIGLTAAKIVKGNTILGLSGTAKAASNLVIETNIYGHNANFNETVPFKYTNNKYAYLKIEYAGYMGCTVKGYSTKIFNQAETEYLERSAGVNISEYSKITVTGVKSTGYTMANIKLTFSNSKPS